MSAVVEVSDDFSVRLGSIENDTNLEDVDIGLTHVRFVNTMNGEAVARFSLKCRADGLADASLTIIEDLVRA